VKTITKNAIKSLTAMGACQWASHARYEQTVMILSHMRGATTAVSHVLCSHPEISGYGETHITHDKPYSPGRLVVNQARRKAWKRDARYLFDKVLHNRLDQAPTPAFFEARTIFLARAPKPTIASIVKLSQQTGMRSTVTAGKAATYYLQRLQRLSLLWESFPPMRRFGVSSERLLSEPDATIGHLGAWLGLSPALTNAYQAHPAALEHGAGDPTVSGKLTRIEARVQTPDLRAVADVPAALSDDCLEAYIHLVRAFGETNVAIAGAPAPLVSAAGQGR
jgi:hypothetical protein